ncbi:MAG: DUF6288 domain-containing protein [Planctomycetota bacterium]
MIQDQSFEIRYVFPGSPAKGLLEVGDIVNGAGRGAFESEHVWSRGTKGYGGPMMEFGLAIEAAEATDGVLRLQVERDGKPQTVEIQLEPIGRFSPTFPHNCEKSARIRSRALDYLVAERNRGWGPLHATAIAGLACLSSDNQKHLAAARRQAKTWGADRTPEGSWSWVIGYRLLFLGEYFLATRDDAVLPGMQALVRYSETMMHPDYGGFGHRSQPEGYGPMVLPTALILAGWEMAAKCGVHVDPAVRKTGLEFLYSGTGPDGYVCYGTEWVANGRAGPGGRGHLGRTGAAVLARALSTDANAADYVARGARFLRLQHEAFADGHADNILGACWAWIGAAACRDDETFRVMMDYSKAWLNLARCHDGSFVALPGRDYAGGGSYYRSSRVHLTASVALLFGVADPRLCMLGSTTVIPGVDTSKLTGVLRKVFQDIEKGRLAKAWKAVVRARDRERKRARRGDPSGPAVRLAQYIELRAGRVLDQLVAFEGSEDYYTLSLQLEAARESFSGVPAFDREAEEWLLLLKGDWKRGVKVGKAYFTTCERMTDKPVASQIKDLKRFAAQRKGSVYAEAALHAVQHLEDQRAGDPARAYFDRRE